MYRMTQLITGYIVQGLRSGELLIKDIKPEAVK